MVRTRRWIAHTRRTAVVFRLPPEVRQSLADVLRTALLSACDDALSQGVSPRTLVEELRTCITRLRAATTTMPGSPAATMTHAAVRHTRAVQWRRTRRRRS